MVRIPLFRQCLLTIGLVFATCQANATDLSFEVADLRQERIDFLREASLIRQANNADVVTPQDLIAASRAEYGRMVTALYNLGYYGGVVSIRIDGREAADISPLESPERIDRIVIAIEPGPMFFFSEAGIAPLSPATEIPENFRIGEPARARVLNDASAAAIRGWREIGHAKAEITDPQITVDHRSAKVAAVFRVNPGPRLSFGQLNVVKTGAVRPNRIHEIAGLPTGTVFSPEELDKASTRLRRTGTFSSVTLAEAEATGPGDTLDIEATVVDAKPRRIGAGIELFSSEGLSISGFWMHRNLLGGAEQLRFEGAISGVGGNSGGEDYSLLARFDRPATFTPDTGFFLEASIAEDNEPDYSERNARIGGGLSHIFSDELSGELGIAYQYTDIDDALGSRSLTHFLIPGRLTYDGRDDALDATRGLFGDLYLTPFFGLDDSVLGTRVFVDGRTYLPFGSDDRFVAAFRAQVGSVIGAEVEEVPANMLFYSGGAGTVRGQSFQSLGVDLPNGEQIGGRSFLGFSAELRAKLRGAWSIVGFADTGYIAANSLGSDNGEWHSGGGIGARYNTGFGPIRVDVATPFDDEAGESFELYIGIGQAF